MWSGFSRSARQAARTEAYYLAGLHHCAKALLVQRPKCTGRRRDRDELSGLDIEDALGLKVRQKASLVVVDRVRYRIAGRGLHAREFTYSCHNRKL